MADKSSIVEHIGELVDILHQLNSDDFELDEKLMEKLVSEPSSLPTVDRCIRGFAISAAAIFGVSVFASGVCIMRRPR